MFVWAENVIELCISCFTVNNWFSLGESAFSSGSGIVMSDKATNITPPTSKCRNRDATSYNGCGC